MGLKKYIGVSVIFIAVVAGYVYSIVSTDYELTLFNKVYSLPIALWAIIPLIVLFLASLLHMFFYNFKMYLNISSLKKDEETMMKLLKSKLLKKDEKYTFKNKAYVELGEIIFQLSMDVKNEFRSVNIEIETIAKDVIYIKNGRYIQTNYKLPLDNDIAIANNINKINEQQDYALEILKKVNEYSPAEVEIAFKVCIENKSMTTIKKVLPIIKLNKEMLMILLQKDSVENEFGLNKDELLKYIEQVTLTKQEFLEIAKLYSSSSSPDDIIALFEELSNKNEDALDAYVYILFVYEMIDKIKDIFSSTTTDDLVAFKALLELRDSGKNYSLDSICYLK